MSAIEAGDFPDTACFEHTIPIKQKGGINVKKRFRSFTAVLLALLMVTTTFSAMPLTVSAAEATEDSVGATSGTTGDCTWTLDDNGVLTISTKVPVTNHSGIPTPDDDEESSTYGQPPIPLPDDDEEPWNIYETFGIPDYPDNSAPWKSYEFSEVVIEDGVTSIGDYAFSNRSDLNHIMIPNSVTSIGNNTFSNCPSTERIIPMRKPMLIQII